jgi:hypothetical protein
MTAEGERTTPRFEANRDSEQYNEFIHSLLIRSAGLQRCQAVKDEPLVWSSSESQPIRASAERSSFSSSVGRDFRKSDTIFRNGSMDTRL